jgi:PPK2 family polyphosphate:nucleotide phosphotransferase
MKPIHTDDFKVIENISLANVPTDLHLKTDDDKKKDILEDISKKLGKLQDKMYANNRYSVLIVLQGMDTSGKDSLIREVFKNFNARGVNVYSFKQPTDAELEHDYLWRHYIALPERGKFAVFNRSHYENVLVTRVHPEYLLHENIPGIETTEDIPDAIWEDRFKAINNFEDHLAKNGMIIIKFFLHLSKEEQRKRLLRRLEVPEHNWKFAAGDLAERKRWDDYQMYYEEAINKTSVPHAPWYTIPADDKKTARLIVAQTILDELEKYDIAEPEANADVIKNIKKYKEELLDKNME